MAVTIEANSVALTVSALGAELWRVGGTPVFYLSP
jgi:hypothetical protein